MNNSVTCNLDQTADGFVQCESFNQHVVDASLLN